MFKKCQYNSPVGPLTLSADDSQLISIAFESTKETARTHILESAIQELGAYFHGKLKKFSVPYRLEGTDFQKRVWEQLTHIPYGKSISYSDLALQLGDLKCIRAAGTANGKNKLPIIIPCHRVIGKDGRLVGFAGGLEIKRWLLKHEGIIRGEQIEIFA